jgi:chromate reductase, NAD(P)H dehydrogenase (quinone)
MSIASLGISGSLRSASTNTAALQAAAELAPTGIQIRLWDGLGTLPHFNPDLDTEPPNPDVARFRAALRAADAVLISSPNMPTASQASLRTRSIGWLEAASSSTSPSP